MLTQPLVAARFHIFSPIALVTNILLWLPMTLGLLSGFVFLFTRGDCAASGRRGGLLLQLKPMAI